MILGVIGPWQIIMLVVIMIVIMMTVAFIRKSSKNKSSNEQQQNQQQSIVVNVNQQKDDQYSDKTIENIEKLVKLRDTGAITEEEFQDQKKKILNM